jgi:hypothetical protein
MQWDYSLTVEVEVCGNCRGAGLFNSAIRTAFDEIYDEEDDTGLLVLKRPSKDGNGEDTLEITLEDDDELADLCVAVAIVKHEKEVQG